MFQAAFGTYDGWVNSEFDPNGGHYTELEQYVDQFNNDGMFTLNLT